MVEISLYLLHFTEVRFASFLSSGFITVVVVNPLKRKHGNWQNAPLCTCLNVNILIETPGKLLINSWKNAVNH